MRCAPSSAIAAIVAAALSLTACGRQPRETTAAPAQTAMPPQAAVAAGAHGDHNPHHGGTVFMKGSDLHYEVVIDPAGQSHHLFFTDATREDLPASIASAVSLTVKRAGQADEPIAMRIDEAGESWVGSGTPVAPPATVRIAFTIRGELYWIDVPYDALRPRT